MDNIIRMMKKNVPIYLILGRLCDTMATYRKGLEKLVGERRRFIGTFIRYGKKNEYLEGKKTILLEHVTDKRGRYVADHIWLDYGEQFKNLKNGKKIHFLATVKIYYKGIGENKKIDYKLSAPKVVNIK